MAVLFIDGFDKYGPAGQNTPAVQSLLTAGEWTSVALTSSGIVAGLSGTGLAVNIRAGDIFSKTLSGNYSRLIGGIRFNSTLAGSVSVEFYDGTTAQATIQLLTTGFIQIRNGVVGTVIAVSSVSVSANSTHYLEWDVTFGNAGAYQVWLDGVSILSGTGDTTGSANNYANVFKIEGGSSSNTNLDDLYLFDATGTTNNAVLLNNPIVETAFVNADAATKQWNNGASIIGANNSLTSGTYAAGANRIYLRPYTAPANMTLNSVSIMPGASSGTISFRPVIYTGVAAGATLLASGSTVVGCTSGVALTMPLTTPLAITGGTTYGVGYMEDTALGMTQSDTANSSSWCAATFSSGTVGTLPAMTTGGGSIQMWGNCTGAPTDWQNLAINPPPDDSSYIYETTVGDAEFFTFPALSSNPASVACVAYKARLKRSDSGAKTVDVRVQSGAADTAGNASSITPGTSYTWVGNYQPTDPATGVAWIGTGINAARGGVKVAS